MPERNPAAALNRIEIFRAGRHTDVNGQQIEFSPADVAAIAASYDASAGEAPLVVGHPQINGPAYGWVKELTAESGVLYAAPHQVDAAFAQLVQDGRFKKRSASFFLPNSPGNPKPGSTYLRHVGFLGAAAPAVAGLRDIQFSATADGVVEFASSESAFRALADVFRGLRDFFIAKDGVESADKTLPQWKIDQFADVGMGPDDAVAASFAADAGAATVALAAAPLTADFAARETAVDERERKIAVREAEIQADAEARQCADVLAFCAGLVGQGRMLPRDQPAMAQLLKTLETAATPQVLNFTAADGTVAAQPAAETLRAYLSAQPVQIDFAERSASQSIDATADFAAPPGTSVNRDQLTLHAKAVAYKREHPGVAWLDAVRAVAD